MSIDTYLDLVTSEYKGSPNFKSWLSSPLQKGEDITILLTQLDNDFDIDTAVGNQLDILGQLIGRSRILTFQPIDGSSPTMTDDTYRLVLKAKIAINQWDGTVQAVYNLWDTLLPLLYLEIYDNQDMSMDVIVVGLTTTLQQELLTNGYLVPKPEGVKINYIITSEPIFAYDLETTSLQGYDMGYWQGTNTTNGAFGYGDESILIKGYGTGVWTA